MKINQFLIILIILIGAISCKDNSKNSTLIPITIASNKPISVKLTQIINIGTLNLLNETVTIDKDNPFIIKQNSSNLTMCALLVKDTMAIFFLDPQNEHKIIIDIIENNSINFKFDKDDHINNFTNYFHSQISPLMTNNLDQKSLFELIEKKEDIVLNKLQQLRPHIDDVSCKILTSMVTGKMTYIKFMHSERFNSLTANSTYYDFVDDYKFDDDNYLTYSDNLNTVLNVLGIQYEREFNKSFDTASNDKFDFINKSIKNKEVKSAIICFLASKIIPEQTNNEKELLLKHLNQFSIKPLYLEQINNTKASTAIGKKVGNKAKYLETLVPFNKDFSIKQIEGKTVYIDNWASWCGPCLESMKAFKEKQKALNKFDDIVFVFVSFDRNEDIWRDFVKKSFVPNHNIIHLYNGMKMNSKYGNYYNISGLPKYFVIDKQGLIYDIHPQTPKDKNFEYYLNKL